jgi:hypothetical protein
VHVCKISYPQEEWNIEKKKNFTRDLLKFAYKGSFLTILKAHQNCVLKIQIASTYFGASSTYKISFFLKNIKISIFGGISKFLKLIVLGQISAKFDNFG